MSEFCICQPGYDAGTLPRITRERWEGPMMPYFQTTVYVCYRDLPYAENATVWTDHEYPTETLHDIDPTSQMKPE